MPRLLGAATVAILVLSACGGGGAPAAATAAATSAAPAAAGDVTVQALKFAPQSLEVKVGTKVTWTNKDSTTHTVTSGTPSAKDGKFDGQLEPQSGQFTFTFATAGTFAYFCQRHPTSMTGTIVVK
jgi:plastocyanin